MDRLLGRDTELQRLAALLDDARAGHGAIAAVVAEGGGGKTSLFEAFAASLPASTLVAWADCLDGEGAPPFWPWIQLLRALANDPERAPRAALALEALATTDGAAAARFSAFDSVARALTTGRGPLVAIIDDLHWADGGSLRLLEFIAPFVRRTSLLLAIGTRPNATADVDATLGALLRRGAIRLPLAPLATTEVSTLLRDAGVAPELAPGIAQRASGNPLYVGELARHLAAGEAIDIVPSSLAELVALESRRLSPESRRLLAVAAALDGDVPPDLALAAAETPDACLDEISRAGLLHPDGGVYRFRHDVVREALRVATAGRERIALDARIAFAADALGDRARAAVHGCRAGSAWNPARAHSLAVEYCARLARRYAIESAAAFADLCRQVRPLLALPASDCLALDLAEGELYTAAGRMHQAREVFRTAATLARDLGDSEALARVALTFGLGYEHGNAHDAEVVSLLEEALAALPAGAHATRARILARLAWQVLGSGRVSPRLELSTRAIHEARMAEEPGPLAAALEAHCWALAAPDQLPERLAAASAAAEAAREAADVDLELGALMWLFRGELESGNVPAARRAAEAFDALSTRYPLPYHRWYTSVFRGCLALIEGRFDEATALASEIDPADTTQEQMARINLGGLLAEVDIARSPMTAAAPMRRMHDLIESTMGIGWVISPILAAFAEGPEAAHAELARSMAIADAMEVDEDWFAITCSHAVAAILGNVFEESRALFDLLEPYADRWIVIANGAICRGPVSALLASLAPIAGRPERAPDLRARALADLERNGARGLHAWLDLRPLGVPPSTAPARPSGLTPREAEVLALVARGHSNQQIADLLVLSVRTVERHVENAYRRIGASNRAAATLAAVNLGLVAPGDVRADPVA